MVKSFDWVLEEWSLNGTQHILLAGGQMVFLRVLQFSPTPGEHVNRSEIIVKGSLNSNQLKRLSAENDFKNTCCSSLLNL